MKENLDFFISLPAISEDHTLTILFDSGYNKAFIENNIQSIYPDILSKVVTHGSLIFCGCKTDWSTRRIYTSGKESSSLRILSCKRFKAVT